MLQKTTLLVEIGPFRERFGLVNLDASTHNGAFWLKRGSRPAWFFA